MKKRLQGLLALWLTLSMVLSTLPMQAYAAGSQTDMYVYTRGSGAGVIYENATIPSTDSWCVEVSFDQPLNEQTNVMNNITIPGGYGLSGWQVWEYAVDSDGYESAGEGSGHVHKKLLDLAADDAILERLKETQYDYGDSLLIVPVMEKLSSLVLTITLNDADLWHSLSGDVSFDRFFSGTQTLKISVEGGASGSRDVQYHLANDNVFPPGSDYTGKELDSVISGWTNYPGSNGVTDSGIQLSEEGQYVLYAKVRDAAGNTAYANTDGIVIDKTAPVITVTNAGTVKMGDTISFTVRDDYLDTVMVDGSVVQPSQGVYTFTASKTLHTITAKDKAGNPSENKVNVQGQNGGQNKIDGQGVFDLQAGVAYTLGSGKWMVEGDSTVYEGGRTFYVSQSGKYTFNKQ